jgi:hypothetical protein
MDAFGINIETDGFKLLAEFDGQRKSDIAKA